MLTFKNVLELQEWPHEDMKLLLAGFKLKIVLWKNAEQVSNELENRGPGNYQNFTLEYTSK